MLYKASLKSDYQIAFADAPVVELVDALDSKSSAARRVGSSPTRGTTLQSRGQMKQSTIKLFVYISISVILIGAVTFWISRETYPDAIRSQNNNTVKVAVADRVFQIEKHFLQTLPLLGENSFLIRLYWPEMISEVDAEEAKKSLVSQVGTLLIEAQQSRPSLDQQLDFRSERKLLEKQTSSVPGLEHIRFSPKGDLAGQSVTDVFIRKENGVVKTKIECPLLNLPYPGCRHKFIDTGLVYSITYNKKNFLQGWRKMESSSIALIDSFEINED